MARPITLTDETNFRHKREEMELWKAAAALKRTPFRTWMRQALTEMATMQITSHPTHDAA